MKINSIIFVIILIIAVLLRFIGINPGYPPYHSDDGITYSSATSMIVNGNLDPLRYDYPIMTPLTNYIVYQGFFIPIEWSKFLIRNYLNYPTGYLEIPKDNTKFHDFFYRVVLGDRWINALFWGRYVTALVGVLVVLITFLITRRLYSTKAGLLSAFFVAINYRHVLNSHLGLPDIYNSFFLLLSFWFTINVFEKPTNKNYFWSAIFAGISFSTKYQFFAFTPLLIVHLINSFKEKNFKNKIRFLFKPMAIMIPVIIAVLFVILNPYHLIKLDETRTWLSSVSGKYRTGRMIFDFYPYSYLYHIGIGKLVSILSLLGVFVAFHYKKLNTALLLSVILPFLFITTYYTGGGFYTRNFVTIIPFLLIFAGVLLSKLSKYKGLLFVLLIIVSRESLSNSLIILKEYIRPWNYKVMQTWTNKNVNDDMVVAAHASVPLPDTIKKVIPYNFVTEDFSMREFGEKGADLVISNLDWSTTDFYGWMTQDTKNSFKYWNKPLNLLESSYAGMSLREFSDYSTFSVVKFWQAPETNYIVAKVPKYIISNKKLFNKIVLKDKPNVWKSEIIDVSNWSGFYISPKTSGKGRGYIYANFFKDINDVNDITKRISVRLSSRNKNKDILGVIPKDTKYMVIGFDTFESYKLTDELLEISIYNAEVKEDLSGFTLDPVKLEDGVIFPNSHGNM
ncbi:MAG: glycosyltransferase family 39 protein [Patescibacteria group bacterium]